MSTGLSGALTQAVFGPVKPSRRQYIETLANSDLVTLEDIDRILRTHYARLPDETRGVGYTPKARGTLSDILMGRRSEMRVDRFLNVESLTQHILDRYVTKSDLQKICQQLGLPGTGNKPDLEARVLSDPSLTNSLALNYVNREDMKKLCVDLKLPTTGTRGDMESRVLNVMARLPRAPPSAQVYTPQRYVPPAVQQPQAVRYTSPPQQAPVAVPQPYGSVPNYSAESAHRPVEEKEPPLESPESEIPPPPPPAPEPSPVPSVPALPGLESVVEFIQKWNPRARYDDESKYEIELAAQLCHRFGDDTVLTQYNVPGGRIDIQVMGVGLELKVPSKVQMQRLIGQSLMYKKHYGPNIIAVIFRDRAKSQDIIAFSNDLNNHGIKVIVK